MIENKGKYTLEIKNITDIIIMGLIKRVLFKAVYCIQCETCEVECPTGALHIYPKVYVDKAKCIQCHRCLNFHEKGCIAANSLYLTTGIKMNKKQVT